MNYATHTFGLSLLLAAVAPGQTYLLGSYGVYANALYGSTVVVGGDFNNDGRADYLVGAPNRSTTTMANIGAVYLVSGANGLVLGGASGTRAGRRIGTALDAIGDVNGDGTPDFVTSSPYDDTNGANAGWVGCYSGANSGLLWQVTGTFPGSWFGQSVVAVPDMNGDGRMDVAVGSPRNNGSSPSGRVYFYSGANGGLIRQLVWGVGAEYFGQTLALVGDQNGDAIPDLAVGATNVGVVSVFRMGSITTSAVWSTVLSAGYGAALAGAGDTNGDGFPDVLIGRAETASLPGSAYLISGLTTQVLRTHFGNTGDRLGAAVAGGLDLDADGRADYVLGAPGGAGGAGRVEVRSGATGVLLFQETGAGNDAAGSAVAMMPDRTGDGLAEIVFGSPGYDTNGAASAGRVSVYGHQMHGRTEYLGGGCTGAFAIPTVTVDTTPLHYGGSAQATAPNLRAHAFGLWMIGLAPQTPHLDLAPFGMPGCLARVATDAIQVFTTNGLGDAMLNIPLPNVPSFTGLRIEVQGACSDPLANAAGFMVTQAWRLIVGNS